jgi:translation initiation factor 1
MNINDIMNGVSDPLAIETESVFDKEVHLRMKKRNNKKCITIIEGLEGYDIDIEKLKAKVKKYLCCNGVILEDDQGHKVLQLQGDHRTALIEILTKHGVKKESIKFHGFTDMFV